MSDEVSQTVDSRYPAMDKFLESLEPQRDKEDCRHIVLLNTGKKSVCVMCQAWFRTEKVER